MLYCDQKSKLYLRVCLFGRNGPGQFPLTLGGGAVSSDWDAGKSVVILQSLISVRRFRLQGHAKRHIVGLDQSSPFRANHQTIYSPSFSESYPHANQFDQVPPNSDHKFIHLCLNNTENGGKGEEGPHRNENEVVWIKAPGQRGCTTERTGNKGLWFGSIRPPTYREVSCGVVSDRFWWIGRLKPHWSSLSSYKTFSFATT